MLRKNYNIIPREALAIYNEEISNYKFNSLLTVQGILQLKQNDENKTCIINHLHLLNPFVNGGDWITRDTIRPWAPLGLTHYGPYALPNQTAALEPTP